MEDLIKSLQIIEKYLEGFHKKFPTHCEHDVLMVPGINDEVWENIPDEVMRKLEELGWDYIEDYGCLVSFRWGSC